MTARALARHFRPATIVSPYSGRTRRIVAAREVGCHVELVTESGRRLLVDAAQKVEEERKT